MADEAQNQDPMSAMSAMLASMAKDIDAISSRIGRAAIVRGQLHTLHADEENGRRALRSDLARSDFDNMNDLSIVSFEIERLQQLLGDSLDLFEAASAHTQDAIAALKERLRFSREEMENIKSRTLEHAPNAMREAVWAITSGRCFYCAVELLRPGDPEYQEEAARTFHVDHLVSKSCGGPDHIANYVPACRTCNISKNGRPFTEFVRKRELKLTVIAGGAQ